MEKPIEEQKVKEELRELIAEIAELEPEEVTDDAIFTDDLGVDSMMALEIVAKIEKKHKVVIPEEKIPEITSLQKVFDMLKALSGK